MKQTTYKIVLLFICIQFFVAPIKARESSLNSDYLLVINTYTESYPWSDKSIEMVLNYFTELNKSDDWDVRFAIEHMNLMFMNSQEDADEFIRSVKNKYKVPPKLTVFVGNGSLKLFENVIEEEMKDLPMLLIAESKYLLPSHYYIEKKAAPKSEEIPIEVAAQEYNLTVAYFPTLIKETIDLMKTIYPEMAELYFMSDKRWVSMQNRYETDNIISQYFPDIKLTHLVVGELSTYDMLEKVRNADNQTGLLFHSWYELDETDKKVTINANSHKLISINTKRPVFALTFEGMENNNMLGGCFNTREQVTQVLNTAIENSLYKKTSKGVEYITHSPSHVVNYPVALAKKVPLNKVPSYAIKQDAPPSFLSANIYYIIGVCFVLLLLLFSIIVERMRRQRNEKELKHMADYQNLINNMPLAYMKQEIVWNEQGEPIDFIIREVNPAFDKYFVPANQVLNRYGSSLPGNFLSQTLHFYKTLQTNKKELISQFTNPLTNKTYSEVMLPSHIEGFVDSFFIETTELIKTQQLLSTVNHKLSMALEVANIVPWRWDLEKGTILCDVNREVTLGDEAGSESVLFVPDKEYFSKVHKEDRCRIKEAFDNIMSGKTAKIKEEYRVIVGSRFEWVEVQAGVDMYDDKGKPQILIGSSLIISERKKMQDELISAKNKAEESNRLKSAFLANMSHEIRTPLNAIVGFSNVLATTAEEDEKEEYLGIIENNNSLLLQLINDILDMSKIEAKTLDFTYTDVDINTLITEVVQATRLKVDHNKVEVIFEDHVPDLWIKAEKNRITQVLGNLAGNATKFTTEGSIRIGYRINKEKSTIRFYVSDTGCGIPRDKKSEVFKRFAKLNDFVQGTGLGLSICQTIIENMGGSIGVESQEGVGSEFWFELPLRPTSRKVDIVQQQFELKEVRKDERLTILIAEDNPDNFKLFRTILGRDYNIVHAWNGLEAIEKFNEHHPHLVLMDISMPVMDGYSATAEIRKISSTVPIIAVTAYAFSSDEDRILKSGFDAYVAKPLNPQIMKSKIVEMLKRQLVFVV